MERQYKTQWALTDEEWCELCFRVVEMQAAHQELQDVLLDDERPTLNQLWIAASAYQRQSQELFNYLGQQLRERAITGERRAA